MPSMRTLFKTAIPALLLPALLITGCGGDSSKGRYPGDVTKVERGMNTLQVESRIGQPAYMNEGEDERTGNDTWVYPTGYILFYRRVVKAVVPVSDQANLPRRQKPREVIGSTRRVDIFEKEDEFYAKNRRKNSIETSPEQWDDNIYRSF